MLEFPNRYCPHTPTERQRSFLACQSKELLFGGAAGGGKSVALLMGALQYVDVPGYAALILRKDTQRLALAGGLIPRSHEWLANCDGVTWNAARRQWSFPTRGAPATINFGYLATPDDKWRYASSEFQYIAFDELTELPETDYRFLFSRLRRTKSIDAPLRIRAASNPGNVGHDWVKRRFVESASGRRQTPDGTPNRVFMPSRLADNPHLDADEYTRSLWHLPPVERERLLHGDWDVREEGLIKPAWLRYYVEQCEASGVREHPDGYVPTTRLIMPIGRLTPPARLLDLLDPAGRSLAQVRPATCRRFITVDPAGTSADRARERRGRPASHTVAQVWDQPRRELSHLLILRHQERGLLGFDELVDLLRRMHDEWRPERIWVENERLGQATDDLLSKAGLPIDLVPTRGRDKATRAARLIVKLSRGEIFLPQYETAWRPDFERELLAWGGTNDEPTDQIDAAAYAAIIADAAGPGILVMEHIVAK
jgi:phage terminase large subunit-like protein